MIGEPKPAPGFYFLDEPGWLLSRFFDPSRYVFRTPCEVCGEYAVQEFTWDVKEVLKDGKIEHVRVSPWRARCWEHYEKCIVYKLGEPAPGDPLVWKE